VWEVPTDGHIPMGSGAALGVQSPQKVSHK